jgi:hypothetical protein
MRSTAFSRIMSPGFLTSTGLRSVFARRPATARPLPIPSIQAPYPMTPPRASAHARTRSKPHYRQTPCLAVGAFRFATRVRRNDNSGAGGANRLYKGIGIVALVGNDGLGVQDRFDSLPYVVTQDRSNHPVPLTQKTGCELISVNETETDSMTIGPRWARCSSWHEDVELRGVPLPQTSAFRGCQPSSKWSLPLTRN